MPKKASGAAIRAATAAARIRASLRLTATRSPTRPDAMPPSTPPIPKMQADAIPVEASEKLWTRIRKDARKTAKAYMVKLRIAPEAIIHHRVGIRRMLQAGEKNARLKAGMAG